MVHIDPDFKTKKEFKMAIAAGKSVYVYQPGPFPLSNGGNGRFVVEAPANYHKWYCSVECIDGKIIKVIS